MQNWNLIFRRTHLYLGMLLVPWLLVYALSTVAYNHPETFRPYGNDPKLWEPLWEKDYALDVPGGNTMATFPAWLKVAGAKVIADQGMKPPFFANRPGKQLIINVPNFRQPLRLIYDPDAKRLRAEQRRFSFVETLSRLHNRSGYGTGTALNDLWAVIVDLFCVTTLVWIATGLYLWWKLPGLRRSGFVAIAGGVATIAILLLTV
jgi:hypothetical protein